MTVEKIRYLDHYTRECPAAKEINDRKPCLLEVIGEVVEEYTCAIEGLQFEMVVVKSETQLNRGPDGSEEDMVRYNYIIKSAIIKRTGYVKKEVQP